MPSASSGGCETPLTSAAVAFSGAPMFGAERVARAEHAEVEGADVAQEARQVLGADRRDPGRRRGRGLGRRCSAAAGGETKSLLAQRERRAEVAARAAGGLEEPAALRDRARRTRRGRAVRRRERRAAACAPRSCTHSRSASSAGTRTVLPGSVTVHCGRPALGLANALMTQGASVGEPLSPISRPWAGSSVLVGGGGSLHGARGGQRARAGDVADVRLEVLDLVEDRRVVEDALAGPVARVERRVQRDRLARAGAELPDDAVGQALEVAARAALPALARQPLAARWAAPIVEVAARGEEHLGADGDPPPSSRAPASGAVLIVLSDLVGGQVDDRDVARDEVLHVGALAAPG